jgi:hypothetical protein
MVPEVPSIISPFQFLLNSHLNSAQQIKRGDQLILRVSDLHTETAKRVPAPIQFDGKALLRYHVSSTQHYLAIKDINLQKSPNRQ